MSIKVFHENNLNKRWFMLKVDFDVGNQKLVLCKNPSEKNGVDQV